jgi:hypothetical protein
VPQPAVISWCDRYQLGATKARNHSLASEACVNTPTGNPRSTIPSLPAYACLAQRRSRQIGFLILTTLSVLHQDRTPATDPGQWLWLDKIVPPPIIDREVFDQVQALVHGRATKHAQHKPHRRQHPYALRGLVICGLCERRMQSHWVNGAPCCRCRFPAEHSRAG